MKVYVNNLKQLNGNELERDLAYYLRDCQKVEGYALMGFKLVNPKKAEQCEVDALVILSSGAIVCIEAKNYGGTWTGSLNGEWFSDDKRIACTEGFANPQQQAERGCFIVKNRIENTLSELNVFVRLIVLAPNKATLNLNAEGMGINGTAPQYPTTVCNLRSLEKVLRTQPEPKKAVRDRFNEIGVDNIIEKLVGTPLDRLTELPAKSAQAQAPQRPVQKPVISTSNNTNMNGQNAASNRLATTILPGQNVSQPQQTTSGIGTANTQETQQTVGNGNSSVAGNNRQQAITSLNGSSPANNGHATGNNGVQTTNTQKPQQTLIGNGNSSVVNGNGEQNSTSGHNAQGNGRSSVKQGTNTTNNPDPTGSNNGHSNNGSGSNRDNRKILRLAIAGAACLALAAIPLYFGFQALQKMNACAEDETFSLLHNNCYKNLAESPLVIGVIGNTSVYEPLQKYLQEKLGKNVVIDQADGQASNLGDEIIKKKWDVVFAYSPMNSILAQDNDYEWLGRMYAKEGFFYESFLVTSKSSPINSIDDITPNTKVALSKVVSTSGFYQPIYDLYGKKFYLVPNVSSRKVGDYLRSGKADVAAVSSLTLKYNPDLKIIHESKQLPGSGLLLSPRLSPDDRKTIKELLFNAPADVKEKVNYEQYPEFDYKEFRVIKSKVDNILSCRPVEEGPFQNFGCTSGDTDKAGIVGEFNGWTRKGDEIVFKLKAGKDNYRVVLDESLLSKIPGCTTPVLCNGKEVAIVDVPVEDDNGQLTLRVRSGDNVRMKE